MPETILQSVLTGALEVPLLLRWLGHEPLEDVPQDCVLFRCNRNEFAAYFLSFLRTQVDSVLQCSSNVPSTPLTPDTWASRQHHRSVSDPTTTGSAPGAPPAAAARHRSTGESPSRERRRPGRRVKAKLFTDEKSKESISSDESRLNTPGGASTPLSLSRSHSRSETPRHSSRHSHTHSRSDRSCLGDYIVAGKERDREKEKEKKKRRSRASDESEGSRELDLSSCDAFPAIGEHKSCQKPRRIKPTSVAPLSSAPAWGAAAGAVLQSPAWAPLATPPGAKSEPVAQSPAGLSIERSLLKLERKRLQDRFATPTPTPVTSTPTPTPVTSTPIVKVTRDETNVNSEYVSADINKVKNKEKLDLIVQINDFILENNLALNVTAEIYRLICVLVSKQSAASCERAEDAQGDMYSLVQSVHSCTYVACRCVWTHRHHAQLLLDDTALKQLGECKSVRSFCPDLAKFLLNEYGLRNERRGEGETEAGGETEVEGHGGVVCFNMETDNVDNFPSVLSFQNFKKQRDMYYEIYRWWCSAYTSGAPRASLRARVKALLAAGGGGGGATATLPHLAALLTRHMLAECSHHHESRLSKLQRRLTGEDGSQAGAGAAAGEGAATNWKELFYREVVLCVESSAWRAHVCDALTAELHARQRAAPAPAPRDYRAALRTLPALARLLAALHAAPYAAAPARGAGAGCLALRNHTQPCIALQALLAGAAAASRLALCLPWLAHYLCALDAASLRTPYYTRLLTALVALYRRRLAPSPPAPARDMHPDTRVFLTSVLGWLFSQPHFPHHIFYADVDESDINGSTEMECERENEDPLDHLALVEGRLLAEQCGVRRGVRAGAGGRGAGAAGRHVTPVTVARGGGGEGGLQARLEAALLGSTPASWRRACEQVAERVAAAACRDLPALLPAARARARAAARQQLACRRGEPPTAQVVAVSGVYNAHLQQLHQAAQQQAAPALRARCGAALRALLPAAPPALAALTARRSAQRVRRWLTDYWPSTAVLCKDIEAEARELLALGPGEAPAGGEAEGAGAGGRVRHDALRPWLGAAEAIILLKEQVCLVLEGTLSGAVIVPSPPARVSPPCARALTHLSLDLAVAVASKRPGDITAAFLQQLEALWSACAPPSPAATSAPTAPEPAERDFREELRAPSPPHSDDDDPTAAPLRLAPAPPSPRGAGAPAPPSPRGAGAPALQSPRGAGAPAPASDDVFDRVLCARNVALLQTGDKDSMGQWKAWALVLRHLVTRGLVEPPSLTEQCVSLYRHAWPPRTLAGLAACLRGASAAGAGAGVPRAAELDMFLGFLSDYCADLHVDDL